MFIRPKEDWIAIALVGIGALLIASVAHADNEIVYKTIAMESANQSELGQELVAHVIINRSRLSGKSLDYVCLKRKQFSCWNSHKWAKTWLATYYSQSVRKRAIMAYSGAVASTSYQSITHYCTLDAKPIWAWGKKPVIIEGNHAFYGGIK